MTNFDVAMSIWWRAIVLNALLTGAWLAFEAGAFALLLIILMIVFGFVIALPLLPIILFLVKLMQAIPYGSKEQLWWLRVMLVFLVWIFYGIVNLVLYSWKTDETFVYLLNLSTSVAVLAAIYFTEKDILKVSADPLITKRPDQKPITYV